ncbi:MAG: hypothetical protein KF886_24050 [Candidatus Hydrogenedentes bacterium]|nr:hypothetical protein [Candidatus Hydrogenedentota bacterium]
MQHRCSYAILAAALALSALHGHTAEMTIDPDGMAVVNGQRTFIIGLYENPSDDAALQDAVKSGVNLVYASPTGESLDRLHAAGAWAWLNTGYNIDFSEDRGAREARLTEAVRAHGDHPALLVWEVPDEALWNAWYMADVWRGNEEPKQLDAAIGALEDADLAARLRADLDRVLDFYRFGRFAEGEALADSIWTALGQAIPRPGFGRANAPERAAKLGEGMIEGYRALRTLDPAHPVWMNHAPRNTIEDLAFFNRGADIVGCDIYPVPESAMARHSDLANRTMGSVGAYTLRMQAAAPDKPVWMVLQGTGWGDFQTDRTDEERALLRRPRKDETRFMAYDAIVHGARGVLYWGSHYVEKDSEFWRELLEVIAELKSLQPVLAAPDAPAPPVAIGPTNGSLDRSVAIRSKAAPDGVWHIVVNEFERPLRVRVAAENAGDYRALETDTVLTAEGGEIVLQIPAYSVAVLRPAP